MPEVTEVLVRFDNGMELVVDQVGEDVSAMELGFRISAAIYRIQAGDTERYEGGGTVVGSVEETIE